jgi:hypothetical protein
MFVLLVAVSLLIIGSGSATAAPPDNPFVGSWETVDDFPSGGDFSHGRLQIGGDGHFRMRDDAATACLVNGFGFVPATVSGFGEITSMDPWIFEGSGELYCYTRDGRGRQLLEPDFPLMFVWDPVTDTLPSDFNCFWRPGTDPTACD